MKQSYLMNLQISTLCLNTINKKGILEKTDNNLKQSSTHYDFNNIILTY